MYGMTEHLPSVDNSSGFYEFPGNLNMALKACMV